MPNHATQHNERKVYKTLFSCLKMAILVFQKFKEFIMQCKRVFTVARKPDSQEVKQVSKVSALGLFIIGIIGFIISLIYALFFG